MASRESKLQYLELKSKLTALNYTEPFKEDACELVNRLVSDLVSTTNAYKIIQEKEARIAQDLALSQAQLFPLRKENARLARENHDLHNDTIRLNDEIRNSTEDYSRQIQRVQEQLQDSRYLCESLNEQLKHKNETIDKLRMAYDNVTDPSLKGPGGSAGANANRAIKMSTKLTGKGGNVAELAALHHAPASTPTGATGAALAEKDGIIRTLRTQLEAANKAFATKDEECRRLSSAVAAREQELARSSKLIASTSSTSAARMGEGGASIHLSSNMQDQYTAADTANKRIIDQLNGQVDFLNAELAKREAQLVEVSDKLMQYESLKMELQQRNQLLDQARKEGKESSARIRALEQKVLEFQQVQAEYAAAIEIANNSSSGGVGLGLGASSASVSGESKGDGAGREAELRMMLGKVAAERDELREEAARLRRINTTLSMAAPLGSAPTSPTGSKIPTRSAPGPAAASAAGGRGAGGRGRGAAGTGVAGRAAPVGEDAKQLAATNVLVMELNAEVERLTKEKHVLNRSVTQRDDAIATLTTERDQLRQRLQAADSAKDKSALQAAHHDLQERYAQVQEQLAALNREKLQTAEFLSAATGDLDATRRRLQEAQLGREDAETRFSIQSKELELLRQSSKRKDADLLQASKEASELRLTCDDLRVQVQGLQARCDAAQRLHEEVQATLDSKTAELAQAMHELSLAKASSATAFGGADVDAQLREDRRRLQARVQELEVAQTAFQRESRGLLRVAKALGVQVQQERAARGLDEEQVAQVLEVLNRRELELAQAQRDLQDVRAEMQRVRREAESHENGAFSLQEQLTELQEVCHERGQEIAQLRADLALCEQRCADLRAQHEDALQHQASADHLSKGAAQQLVVLRRDLQMQSDTVLQLQQALATAEEERDTLRRQCEDLGRRAKADRTDVTSARAEIQRYQTKCEQLQTLVNTTEAAMRREAQKGRSLAAEVERGGEEQQAWEQEQTVLRAALDDRDSKIRSLQESLQHVDREKDDLEERYEQLEERLQQAAATQRHLEMQFTATKTVLETTERKVQTLTADLTTSQRHAHAADARVNAAQLEIAELKRRLGQKSVEVGGAAQDLMLMTRENQALTSELVQVSAERDRLQQRLNQVLQASASTEHARRAAEIEKSDLLNNYRAVLNEKRKLEEDVTSLSALKEQDGLTVQQLRDKVASLQGVLAAQSAAETRWRGERAALMAQLDTLNDHLVRTQQKVENVEADNRKIQLDANGLKQSNVMLNERINMIIRRAGAATEANKLLTGRLGAVERERDAVRALVGIERQRAADMSHVAEAARLEAAAKEMHIQRLRAVTSTGTAGSSAAAGGAATTTTTSHYTYSTSQRVASSSSSSAQAAYSSTVAAEERAGSGGNNVGAVAMEEASDLGPAGAAEEA